MDAADWMARITFDPHGEGALHLVAGGLVVMAAVVAGLVTGAVVSRDDRRALGPARAVATTVRVRGPELHDPRHARQAADDPVGAFERGRVAGRKLRARTLDDVLDRMVQGGLGEPRIVRSAPNLKVIRLHDCRTCGAFAIAGRGLPKGGLCHFERGFLEAAFGGMVETEAVAKETRCRAAGEPWCEFEVRYA